MSNIIFLDFETTGGIGKQQKKDHLILEIGLLAVDVPSFTEVASWSSPIRWDQHRITEAADDFVLKMHTKNGLISEIINHPQKHNNFEHGGLPIVQQAEKVAIQFVEAYGGEKPELCGAGPEFDRDFMEIHMPELAERFHYRNFDTNAFWLLKKFMGDWDGQKDQQPHRALPDCRRELQAVLDHFTWIGQALRG
jgi:oligoribonuclease (3'-5' exoribonuclease)